MQLNLEEQMSVVMVECRALNVSYLIKLKADLIKNWHINLRGRQGGNVGRFVGKKGNGGNDIIVL